MRLGALRRQPRKALCQFGQFLFRVFILEASRRGRAGYVPGRGITAVQAQQRQFGMAAFPNGGHRVVKALGSVDHGMPQIGSAAWRG
ncbi:hypothetical protein G6F23_014850 [Rhizopus arrhizus]|nr:hypothetical protein G6F23_014850 [Rhizopus arrhizus]